MAGLPLTRSQSYLPRRTASPYAGLSALGTGGNAAAMLGTFAERILLGANAENEAAALQSAEQEGTREGLAAANEGRLPEKRGGTSAADLAFNRTIATAYFARRQIAIDDGLAKLAGDNALDLDAFDKAAQQFRSQVKAAVPAELASDFEYYVDKEAGQHRLRIATGVRKDAENKANAVHVEAFSRSADKSAAAWRSGDMKLAAEQDLMARVSINSRSDLTPQQKTEVLLKLEQRGQRELLLGGFDRAKAKGLDTAETYIDKVRKRTDIAPGLRDETADWMNAHLSDLRREQREQEADRKAQAKDQRERWKSDFTLQFDDGRVSATQIEQAYSAGLLEPQERTHFHTQLRKRDGDIAKVERTIAGQDFLDPKETADRKALDVHFGRRRAGWAQLAPEERQQRELDYAAAAGMVPDSMRAALRVDLRHTDPERVAGASSMVNRLLAVNPSFRQDFTDDELRMADSVSERIMLGEKPKDAAAASITALSVPPAERKARQERFKDEKPEVGRKWLEKKATGGWFSSLPSQTGDAMYGDWRAAYEQEYMAQGNADLAKELAWKRVNRTWAVTEADGGGRRWMRYAPEAVYGNAYGTKWIGEQLQADVTANGAFDGETAGRLRLEPDALTPYEVDQASGAPTPFYRVLLKDKDGAWRAITTQSGEPMRWRPDWSSLPEAMRKKYIEAPRETAAAVRRAALAAQTEAQGNAAALAAHLREVAPNFRAAQ